jgi:hypothetical protein
MLSKIKKRKKLLICEHLCDANNRQLRARKSVSSQNKVSIFSRFTGYDLGGDMPVAENALAFCQTFLTVEELVVFAPVRQCTFTLRRLVCETRE